MSPIANDDILWEESLKTIKLITERNLALQKAYNNVRYELFNKVCHIEIKEKGYYVTLYDKGAFFDKLEECIAWAELEFEKVFPTP